MPLLAPSVRVTINGSLGQGEVFSTGYWIVGQTPAGQAQADTATAAMLSSTAWINSIAGLNGYLTPDGRYTNVRVYWYTQPGAPAAFITTGTTGPTAGTGGRSLPYQTCAVTSLRTATLTRSGRGRMYIPIPGASLTNNQLTSVDCTAIATYVKQNMGAAVAALLTASPAVVVMSSKSALLQPVTKLIVDSRCDVQRRRAQKETILFSNSVAIP